MIDRIRTEHEEQRELVSWFRKTYPGVVIFAIPNGGARSASVAGRLKAEGVLPGVPDLFIPEWRMWIEMKRTKGGSISEAQRKMHWFLEDVGYCVIIAKGCEEAKQKILMPR